MRYLLAILFPPAAVAVCGRWRDLWANVPLTALLWLPGVIHALVVVQTTDRGERADRVATAVLAREERELRARRRRVARYASARS